MMATYFIIYIRITASSPNRHARAVFLGRLFIRQISARLAFPAKPETAYGNAPEPTRPVTVRWWGGEGRGARADEIEQKRN